MSGKPSGKALSARALETMKSGDSDKADVGENRGLRVSCGKTGVKSLFIVIIALSLASWFKSK